MGADKKGHPPYLRSDKYLSSPQFFAPKIQEKVSLPLGGKNFGKNLWENVSGGEGKPPILAEIEGEVLIMTKDV